MAKLVWRVKLVAELEPSVVSETKVARIERDDYAVPETVGLRLNEGKRLMAATQTEIVRAQASTMGEPPSLAMVGLRKTSRAPWSEQMCGAARPPPCCRMAMPVCEIFSAPYCLP